MAFRGANGGKIELVVNNMAMTILGPQSEEASISASTEGDYLFEFWFLGRRRDEGGDEDVEGIGACVSSLLDLLVSFVSYE